MREVTGGVAFSLLFLGACASWPTSAGADEVYVPEDLESAFVELNTLLGEERTREIRATESESEFVTGAHFDLGRWIRNSWGLWGGSRLAIYFNRLGVRHPDDMSTIVLTSYYRHLRDEPVRLDEQVATLRP